MAITTINWDNKSDINTTSTPAINKVAAADMNEIKSVVNTNANLQGDLANLNTTDKSSLVGAVNEVKSDMQPIVLYNDSTAVGTYTQVALTQDVSNFAYLTIYGRSNGGTYFTKKIPTSKPSFILDCLDNNNSGTNIWAKIEIYSIEDTTLTPTMQSYRNINTGESGSSTTQFGLFYIYRVEGSND